MSEVICGAWVRRLDCHGRIDIPLIVFEVMRPAPVRQVMVGRLPGQVVAIHSLGSYQRLIERATRENDRLALRALTAFFERAAVQSTDEHHRVTIPVVLRRYAELEGLAYLVGCGDGLRLMSLTAWVEEMAELEAVFRGDNPPLRRGIYYEPDWRATAKQHRIRVPSHLARK